MGVNLIINWKTIFALGTAALLIILGTKLDSDQAKDVLNTIYSNQHCD